MIDGVFKRYIDPCWEYPARLLVRVGLSANQVTVIGLVLVVLNCALFLLHRSTIWFGVGLAVTFAADSLDGAVARLRNECSMFGGYLDAVVDRYQELIVFLTLGYFTGAWLATMVALSGAFLTSYAKARTAVEMPISNDHWPDLFERLERTVFLCVLLVANGVVESFTQSPQPIMEPGLWLFGALAHGTAIQRFYRARGMLLEQQRVTPDPDNTADADQ